MKLSFVLNNMPVSIDVDGSERVLDLMRERFGLTGTKEGCRTGECGACTLWVDQIPRLSCLMVAAQLAGTRVTTIEGLDRDGRHPVQEAFVANGAIQCGYCTPGMVMTAAAFLADSPNPDREAIRTALSGNLCRCTGYHKIIDAVASAAGKIQEADS